MTKTKKEILLEEVFALRAEKFDDVFFDSTVHPRPLVIEIEPIEARKLLILWGGEPRLTLSRLYVFGSTEGEAPLQLGVEEALTNAEPSEINGVQINRAASGETGEGAENHLSVPFDQTQISRVEIERLAHFMPMPARFEVYLEQASGEPVKIYDHKERLDAFKKAAKALPSVKKFPVGYRNYFPVIESVLQLNLDQTRGGFARITRRFGLQNRTEFGEAFNRVWLLDNHIEYGQHGVSHSFRFYSDDEKALILNEAARLAAALKSEGIESFACYGLLLGMVREQDLIPHDDDIDLLVINSDPKVSQLTFLVRIAAVAVGLGFEVLKVNATDSVFVRLKIHGQYDIDLFVGEMRGDECYFVPSRTQPSAKDLIYPIQSKAFFGVDMPVPNDPEPLLVNIYGEDWRTPVSSFKHEWKKPKT